MRRQLEVDILANCNKDLAAAVKDLLEKHNALVADYNALLAKLDGDDGITDVDYVATETSTNTVDID